MFAIIFFIFGTIIGSFLNVLIYRLPQGKSVIYPPSGCPQCGHTLRWHELVPLASFCLQQGKCRHCGGRISWQYPLVELSTGLIYLFLYTHYALTLSLLTAMPFAALLICITVIDFQHQIIPDGVNMAGAIIGMLALTISDVSAMSGLGGACLGGAVMLLIAIVSRGGMGGGDIKMMAWLGLLLGWERTLLALFLSFIIGGLGSLLLMLAGIKKRKDFIPFGPFLAVGGFTAYVFGNEILTWYLKAYIH